jgi:hypothetical protein
MKLILVIVGVLVASAARTLKMRRGVYSLREKARNTAPTAVFSSVRQIDLGMVSVSSRNNFSI